MTPLEKTIENCSEGPVAQLTGCDAYHGTPYQAWLKHHSGCHGSIESPLMVQCSVCKAIAVREIKFLTSLPVSKFRVSLRRELELLKREFLKNEGWKSELYWWSKKVDEGKIMVSSVDEALKYEEEKCKTNG